MHNGCFKVYTTQSNVLHVVVDLHAVDQQLDDMIMTIDLSGFAISHPIAKLNVHRWALTFQNDVPMEVTQAIVDVLEDDYKLVNNDSLRLLVA